MKCLNDIEIMEFISDKLDAEHKAEVQEHLAGCTDCSRRAKETSTLWDTLGHWEIDTSSHNIADKVIASIEKSESTQKHTKFFAKHEFLMDALKIAASVIIAIGIGQKLGKISAGEKPPAVVSSQKSPEYIATLSLDWAGDFTWLVMEEDSSIQENK